MSNLLVTAGAVEPFLDSIEVITKTNSIQENNTSAELKNSILQYQLPTSPEIQLKKIFSKYYKETNGIYEIAHAFRDEIISAQHQKEFTMIEWYRSHSSLTQLIKDIRSIIDIINSFFQIKKNTAYKILTYADVFSLVYQIKPLSTWTSTDYLNICKENSIQITLLENLKKEKKSIRESWLIIQAYSVLFDNAISKIKNIFNEEIIFITDFPACVRGLSKLSQQGWSMRCECFINGIEVANGYQEIDDPEELNQIWEDNNELRKAMNKNPYPIDKKLIQTTSSMKDVAGIAMGLERLLMALFEEKNIISFFSN